MQQTLLVILAAVLVVLYPVQSVPRAMPQVVSAAVLAMRSRAQLTRQVTPLVRSAEVFQVPSARQAMPSVV